MGRTPLGCCLKSWMVRRSPRSRPPRHGWPCGRARPHRPRNLGDVATTMQDIARLAGVSRVAVSYALNGRPGVSAQVRERILSIAREVGFSPNAQALALRGAAANAVGLVLQRPSSGFHQELISGMQIAL